MRKYEDLNLLMKFKPEVCISMLHLPIVLALPLIKEVFVAVLGTKAIPRCCSFEEGIHGKNSFHPKGLALDLSCRRFTANKQNELTVILSRRLRELDPHWQVVLEFDIFDSQGNQIKWGHLHLEYDIRLAVTYMEAR